VQNKSCPISTVLVQYLKILLELVNGVLKARLKTREGRHLKIIVKRIPKLDKDVLLPRAGIWAAEPDPGEVDFVISKSSGHAANPARASLCRGRFRARECRELTRGPLIVGRKYRAIEPSRTFELRAVCSVQMFKIPVEAEDVGDNVTKIRLPSLKLFRDKLERGQQSFDLRQNCPILGREDCIIAEIP
jgi:hypothetical protein